MKTSSSSGIKTAPAGKTMPRSTALRRAGRSEFGEGSRTQLQVSPQSALALITFPAPAVSGNLRRVRFGYFKPEARDVHVAGSFNRWDPRANPMHRDALGDWSVELELPTGEHRYRFIVDGEWHDDPSAQQTAQNPFGGFDAIMVVV